MFKACFSRGGGRVGRCTVSNWDHFWKSTDGGRRDVSWAKRRVVRVLLPFLSGRARVLDAGCGSGFFSGFFCDQGLETVALDYSPEALDLAARRTGGRARGVRADILDPHFPELIREKFDVIFSDGLFEHFSPEEQDVMVRNLSLLLTENGILATFVPNRWSPWQLIRPFLMPGIREDPFDYQGLLELYARNGMAVLSSGGVNVVPIRFSPEAFLGRRFGMLLFAIGMRQGSSV